MDHPQNVRWETSSYSMKNPIRDCVRIGTPQAGTDRYLGDSQNPDAGALTLPAGELAALLRTA